MGSYCSSCSLEDGPTLWYLPDSAHSLKWQTSASGFGQGRNKSFRAGASQKKVTNRQGNENGELSGKIKFYTYANADTNYKFYPPKPSIKLKKGTKLFAKVFFSIPLGRMPVGENNVSLSRTDLDGQGPVLIAPCPRIIALFLDIDGKPQRQEHFCQESASHAENYYEDTKLEPNLPERAVKGSFFTYLVSRNQDEFFFLHLPLIANLNDCNLRTGNYGVALVRAFTALLSTLKPGMHEFNLSVHMHYDHCDFNCLPLNRNINARGKWYPKFDNQDLKEPHPEPNDLYCPDDFLAEGSFQLDIPEIFAVLVDGLLDRKPPRPRYPRSDADVIMKDAKTVAAGQFCGQEEFDVEGLPDLLILTSDREERQNRHKETGYRHKFEIIEFCALWLNKANITPDAQGTMIEGGMARGEPRPRQYSQAWTSHPITRHGEDMTPKPLNVKNKYIRLWMKKMEEGTLTRSNTVASLIGLTGAQPSTSKG